MPFQGEKCPASSWKGEAGHSMAAAAQCTKIKEHGGWHKDKNGNHFTGSGLQSEVVVVRGKKVSA